jgi:hypothetical protein
MIERLFTTGTTIMAASRAGRVAAVPGWSGRIEANTSAARPVAQVHWPTLNAALAGEIRSTACDSPLASAVQATTPIPASANSTGVRTASNRSRASSSLRYWNWTWRAPAAVSIAISPVTASPETGWPGIPAGPAMIPAVTPVRPSAAVSPWTESGNPPAVRGRVSRASRARRLRAARPVVAGALTRGRRWDAMELRSTRR